MERQWRIRVPQVRGSEIDMGKKEIIAKKGAVGRTGLRSFE
jgi:hypothetical protein